MNENEFKKVYVSIVEFASLTGLSRGYIRQLVKAGILPSIRIGAASNAVYKIHFKKAVCILENMSESGVANG